ncbi:hypothetical protein ACJX0I_10660 [Enterobacter hormaechei subsp. xiangfangensis]|uniref:hypothetical protein n=1 Tax=Enterobacter hormaechei TaxID=158836 RepID=UPI003DA2A9F6
MSCVLLRQWFMPSKRRAAEFFFMVNFLLFLLFNCVIAVRLYTHGKVASAGNADSPRIASPIIWLLLADELAQRGNGALNVLDRVNRHGDTHTVSSCSTLGAQRFNVLARLKLGAYLSRLTVIEILKIIVKTVD